MKAHQHPRLLTNFCWHSTPEWRGVLTEMCAVDLRKGNRGDHEIVLPNGLIVRIFDDRLEIPKGYASDLCSPAIRIGKRWVGTITTKREALAAFVHDVLRQLLGMKLKCLSWLTRKMTDDLFFDFLTEAQSRVTTVYHRAVSGLAGTVFIWLTAKPQQGHCKCHPS